MSDPSNIPIFCDNIGVTPQSLNCCYSTAQNSSECQSIFHPNSPTLDYPRNEWITTCKDNTRLYSSATQDTAEGDGTALFKRYNVCANLPTIASFSTQGILSNNISSSVAPHLHQNATDDELMNITTAVTSCLTQTCRHARNSKTCNSQCSPVRLLINSTMPNITGLNTCLNTLCSGHDDSLPYADPDIIGVGVFASYIMQCALVFIILLLFLGFERFLHKTDRPDKSADTQSDNITPRQPHTSEHRHHLSSEGLNSQLESTHGSTEKVTSSSKKRSARFIEQLENFDSLLIEFHKAQCFFSGTIQIASLLYGIFEVDLLKAFMLIPLATNGVLPVTLSYLLFFHWQQRHFSWREKQPDLNIGMALITSACWILSTVVYWILYAQLVPTIGFENRAMHPYQQFFYKLSAIPLCGDYSALALCQSDFFTGNERIDSASRKLRRLTPIIWTFSTICLLTIFSDQFYLYWKANAPRTPNKRRHRFSTTLFYVAILFLSAGIGMQLSLLSIGTSLNMMDRTSWSFGQVVAVTVWVPPFLGYIFSLFMAIPKFWGKYSKLSRSEK